MFKNSIIGPRCSGDYCGLCLDHKMMFHSFRSDSLQNFLCEVSPFPEVAMDTKISVRYMAKFSKRLQKELESLKISVRKLNEKVTNMEAGQADIRNYAVPNGLMLSPYITISGRATRMGFRISFMKNSSDDLIAFQMSADFSRKVVSRNSFIRKDWGTTERYGGFPFTISEQFNIIILIEQDCFQVRINGQDFCSFDHRFKELDELRLLRVEGVIHDFKLQTERIIQN